MRDVTVHKVCAIHGASVMGGLHKYMHSHVFMCLLIHLWPQMKLEMLLDMCVHVSYLFKMRNGRLPPV